MSAPRSMACRAGVKRLLLSLVAVASLASAVAQTALAQGTFDIATVPRPDGAEISAADRATSSSITYVVPGSVANMTIATERALTSQGWQRFSAPDQPKYFRFKKGSVAIYVSYTMSAGKADRSRLSYSQFSAVPANVPFPDDAIDIVYDENRPYLNCVTGMTIDAALDFFTKGLAAEGWSPLDTATITARWPHAKIDAAFETGKRVYFNRDGRGQQSSPTQLTLRREDNGKTLVELRTAPFARPQTLEFHQEYAGLPASKNYKRTGALGSEDSVRREATALVIAEIPAVLAFYRRELTSRGYQEQAAGASIAETAVKVIFTKPEETAVLDLRQQYDMIDVRLVAQLSQAAIAARVRAKQEADAKWMRDARRQAEEMMAASDAKRRAAAAAVAAAPVETLRPLANAGTPIPLPENAAAIKFSGDDGKLEFTSPSTPKSVAGFYRGELKAQGWKEVRSPIDNPTMVRLDFTKGAQKIAMTVMHFGGNARVSADGTGLQVPADPNREKEKLEGVDVSGFPVPKVHTMSAPGTWNLKGSTVSFRRDYNAIVPSDIGSVLAFYRRELAQRAWTEQAQGAVVTSDRVALAFKAPDGPAKLILGRKGKETTISIVVKNPTEAAKAGILPPSGKATVILGNLGDTDASVTLDKRTIKVKPGAGESKTPDGPKIELKPGTYKYVLKVAGKPNQTGEIVVGADDAWGLMIGPGGILPLHMY